MDYKGHLCPVCNEAFKNGDDVVVCPICGTPHHRDCYELKGQCINQNRHRENYDYARECEVNSDTSDELICAFCGTHNPTDSKFCNSCGKPVGTNTGAYSEAPHQNENNQQPMSGFGGAYVMDPLGGVKADEDLGNGVKASEAAKFIKTSTPYFIPQFKQLKERGRTRFSFVGFIFSGGWMLYRKMYKIGTLFTVLLAALTLTDLYISIYHKDAVLAVGELYNNMLKSMPTEYGLNIYGALSDFFASLNTEQLIICIASTAISVFMILLRVIGGVCGNRWYYKHTIKTVSKIKQSEATPEEVDKSINTKGGVNVALAISLIVSYYILIYLPMFL